MKFFSADLDSLRKLYGNHLPMPLSTGQQIRKAAPETIEKATDVQLKTGVPAAPSGDEGPRYTTGAGSPGSNRGNEIR